MKSTGGDIIKLKDQIHTLWFELQRNKRGNHGHSFLQKPIYDEIVRLGHEAVKILKEIEPRSPYIRRIEEPLFEVERKSWVAEDISFIGPKPYYVMTPEAGQSVITQDINQLANKVHHAGMSVIKAREEYCGCEISEEVEDISSINTGVLKYCEGALKRYDRTAWILGGGDKVEHRPGSAANHANTVKFVPTEKGYELDMEYVESGDSNWLYRQDGVIDYVRKIGGQCERAEAMTKCNILNLAEDEILKLALMITQLKDIDLMHKDCIPMAFELIEEQADELAAMEPKDEIWDQPWTVVSDMVAMMDCQGNIAEEEEERRDREEIIGRRLERDIEAMNDEMEWAIKHSKTEPCTYRPYAWLDDHDFAEKIHEACQRLKKETIRPYGWCVEIADRRKQEIKEAAKDLVSRCPPEGIILGLEAGNYPYSIDQIERICKLAENQDCLDIIRQVEARAAAGIKAAKLELKIEGE